MGLGSRPGLLTGWAHKAWAEKTCTVSQGELAPFSPQLPSSEAPPSATCCLGQACLFLKWGLSASWPSGARSFGEEASWPMGGSGWGAQNKPGGS